ncbi:MAG: molybdopterin-dependent oxidoreductase [Candidatus Promineifilaceae bacterium]
MSAFVPPDSHEPNHTPPSADPTFVLELPDGRRSQVGVALLRRLPRASVPDCYVVSTGHGISGPFRFEGVRLRDIVGRGAALQQVQRVDVLSADGFSTSISAEELAKEVAGRPILLADSLDGRPMSRDEGLVRLVVPADDDDALRQVKWVSRIVIAAAEGPG